MTVIDILVKYQQALSDGLMVTFELVLIIWSVGLLLGSILGSLAARWKLVIGIPTRMIAFVLSGMPVLVFLFWLHYPLQSMLGIVVDPFITAVVTLSILNTFAVCEVVRIVLRDFPQQYIIAARVCGLTAWQTLVFIQLPIVLRQTIPSLLMIQVNMLQATLFASLISVNEIFRVAQQINSVIYKPVEIYTTLGILFLAICLPMNGFALWLRQQYTRDFSER
jgi:His/Glu/Gln/Arg/opine family amino acid ABC transporter permease subunit